MATVRTLATLIDEAEADLNLGLRNLHQLVSAATATAARSRRTGGRMENERTYLDNENVEFEGKDREGQKKDTTVVRSKQVVMPTN